MQNRKDGEGVEGVDAVCSLMMCQPSLSSSFASASLLLPKPPDEELCAGGLDV